MNHNTLPRSSLAEQMCYLHAAYSRLAQTGWFIVNLGVSRTFEWEWFEEKLSHISTLSVVCVMSTWMSSQFKVAFQSPFLSLLSVPSQNTLSSPPSLPYLQPSSLSLIIPLLSFPYPTPVLFCCDCQYQRHGSPPTGQDLPHLIFPNYTLIRYLISTNTFYRKPIDVGNPKCCLHGTTSRFLYLEKNVKLKSVAAQREFCDTASAINLFIPLPAESFPPSQSFPGIQDALA